ncbi:FAD-dependent oxidoreductase [Actinomadura rugatobispora]|uniref:FAD-dependent oxidoreductase n=1 Tax=Actinomadura rugatobispora TaxID=1994 RepID=A0ABW0ZYD8_9ACTN|nr:FAD-dependent monooxygenase [Actinomadura rugatobispora]
MRVVVAGGGVAGAASAIAFRRIGAEVTVYESHADPAGPVGSFISLAANGLRGLEALGCLDRVRDAGFPVPRQRLWAGSGKLLGDLPRGRLSDDPTHSVTLWRGRLVEELRAEAVRLGAEIVTGERLTGADTEPSGGVRARFESGRTAEGDLLTGADGIWSATRRILAPSAPGPVYGGYYTVSGVASGVDAAPGTLEPGTFNMVFARAGTFISIAVPDGTVWWAAQVTAPEPPGPGTITPDSPARLYRDEEHPSAVLRAATETHRPAPHHVLESVRVWHGDRTVLVGDAAHPVGAGQGASMAVEDAVVLARAAATEPTVPTALAAYERDRRARTAKLVRMAAANRDAKTAGPVARRVQNIVMPLALRVFYERSTAWLYDHDLAPLPPSAA